MNKTIYCIWTDAAGVIRQGVYTMAELISATWNPLTTVNYLTDFTAKSKEAARDLAIEFFSRQVEASNSGELLSYSEYADIGDALYKLARRWGLVREFKESGVI